MRKTKFSLSFLAMLVFMVVFSATAMAAGVTGLKANVENNVLKASWDALDDATQYEVTVTDITDADAPVALVTDEVTTEISYSIAVTESTLYEVTVASDSTANPDAVTIEVWSPASNEEITSTDVDNGIGNANLTGDGVTTNDGSTLEDIIKSDGMTSTDGTETQRTHGEYHNNTNSCASCHQTHTGASKSLLFKDGVYNTCSACHDGTLGFYNVFESHEDLGSAGTFGGTDAGNMSVHLANGATTLKAAPGGNLNGEGSWSNEFNCASCHSPHGSYSDRLLHYNPNSMGIKNKDDGGIGAYNSPVVAPTPDATTGLITNASVAAAANALTGDLKNPELIVVRGTKTSLAITNSEISGADDVVVVVYKKGINQYTGAISYSKEMSAWLYGYDYGSPQKAYWTRFYTTETVPTFYDKNGKPTRVAQNDTDMAQVIDTYDGVNVEFDQGYAWGQALGDANSAEVGRAYVVKLDLMPILDPTLDDGDGILQTNEEKKFGDLVITTSNQRALFAGETHASSTNIQERWGVTPGATVKGWGIAVSDYCAACHTDYLAHSGSESGTWNQAYRHSTDSDSYTCVRCHFAHGTDVEIMRDAQNNTLDEAATKLFAGDTVKATDYMLDKNNSSALKRYTNMSVCWACHTSSKAEQLKNTDSYDENDPHGLADEEGKQNWPN